MRTRLTCTLLSVAALVLLGVGTVEAASPAGEPVAVTNGDFERGKSNWEGPGEVVTDERHGGRASMLVPAGKQVHFAPRNKQMVPIEPGHDYRVSVWVKADGVQDNGASITGVFLSDTGKWLGSWVKGADPKFVHDGGASPALLATGGTHGWKRLEAGIPADQIPGQAKVLFLYLRHDAAGKNATGRVWFDDLAVERLAKGSIQVKPRDTEVINGGFEHGKAGWGGSGQVVADTSAVGGHALRVSGGHALQMNIAVEGGKTYRVSMKIRADGQGVSPGYVQYSFRGGRGANGWHGPIRFDKGRHTEAALFVADGGEAWKDYAAVIRAPKNADQMLVYLRHDGAGAALYDEVTIEPTDEPVTTASALRAAGMAPAEPLLDDTDFARETLVNTDFEAGTQGWLVSGVAEASGGTLRFIRGRAIQGKKVDDRKRYRVSVRIRTQAAADGAAAVRLQFRGPRALGRGDQWARPITTGGTQDWRTYSAVVAIPRSATDMLVYLEKELDDGTAWFDDVAVEVTDEPVTPDGQAQREAELAKLLPSGGANAAAVLAAIVAQGRAAEAAPPLAENGVANYAIHVGSADDPVVLHAAEELADYLGRITGADFTPLSHDANPIDKPLIIVGRHNALTDRLIDDLPYDAIGEEGFVIRSVGPHVVVTGAQPRGTLYGVYWLLDRKLGVRWWSPEFTHVPRDPSPALGRLDERQTPRFTYREIFSKDTDDPAYRQHNLLNGDSHHRGHHRDPAGIDTWSSYWPEAGGHNFHRIVSHKKYGKEHPEWFAGGQLAMMNEDVRRVAAEELTKIIAKRKQKGQEPVYVFSQEDRGWNPDPQSRAFANAHGGSLAAPTVDMVADIAAQVRQTIPDARLATLAYHWSFPAPVGMTVPDYVVMTVAPIEANFAVPFDSDANREIGDDIAGWAKIANHIVIWDYITNFGSYIQPFPNLEPMFANIRWLAQHDAIRGYFGQGSYTTHGAEFAELRAWVAGRLLWNPQQDPRALVDEFLAGYYGDAAPYIRQYFDLLRDSVAQTGSVLTIRTQVTAPYLSFDVLRRADELLEQAAAAVADQPGFDRRVQTARIGVDYVILLRRADYKAAAEAQGVTWDPQTEARLARFAKSTAEAGVGSYGEGVGSIAALLETMKIERRVAEPPAFVRSLSPSDWVDYQDLDVRLYRGRVVGDPLASDAGALRMEGDNAVWGVQMVLDSLPPEGAWKLHVRVRIDPGQSASDEARAMSFGVHPGESRTVQVGEVADGQYHWFEVPGTYQHDPGRALWFAPPKSRAIEAMFIDRVVATRAAK